MSSMLKRRTNGKNKKFDPKGLKGITIPLAILRSNLSNEAKLLLGTLIFFSKDGSGNPSDEKVAESLGWEIRTVELARVELILNELIEYDGPLFNIEFQD